jgi:hypothetical protein
MMDIWWCCCLYGKLVDTRAGCMLSTFYGIFGSPFCTFHFVSIVTGFYLISFTKFWRWLFYIVVYIAHLPTVNFKIHGNFQNFVQSRLVHTKSPHVVGDLCVDFAHPSLGRDGPHLCKRSASLPRVWEGGVIPPDGSGRGNVGWLDAVNEPHTQNQNMSKHRGSNIRGGSNYVTCSFAANDQQASKKQHHQLNFHT